MENKEVIRSEHPRPDFKRERWHSLNGVWEFEFDDLNQGINEKWYGANHSFTRQIQVPFVYQAELSGIGTRERHDIIWYRREFILPEQFVDQQILLKIGAADYYTQIWVNGVYIGEHTGGYTPMEFEITNTLHARNTVVIRVEDRADQRSQPRGKQSWMPTNFGCWYTGFTGIWQSVWLEAVAAIRIKQIRFTPDVDHGKVKIDVFLNHGGSNISLQLKIHFGDLPIVSLRSSIREEQLSLEVDLKNSAFEWDGLKLWSPEDPNLYNVELGLFQEERCLDRIESYFGLRKVSIYGNQFLLNNKPYYQKLILAQGYYDRGWITAPDEGAFLFDLDLIKEMGFNGLRMHQKIEDPLFLYWCDRKGLLVWEEMPSFYSFEWGAVERFLQEWTAVIQRDYNHPSIVAWVPFNESWGISAVLNDRQQQETVKAVYYLTKALDPTRVVIDNDGWEHTETDLCTIHDYEPDGEEIFRVYADQERVLSGIPSRLHPRHIFAAGHTYKGQPILLTEFGGLAFATTEGWGYGEGAQNQAEFIGRLQKQFQAIKDTKYLVGYCYTQLTDVEQEQNGLMTIDRKLKVELEQIQKLNSGK